MKGHIMYSHTHTSLCYHGGDWHIGVCKYLWKHYKSREGDLEPFLFLIEEKLGEGGIGRRKEEKDRRREEDDTIKLQQHVLVHVC